MKPARILVVDDEPRIVRLVRANLKPAGYTVMTAGDGTAALRAVEMENPDLVILDIRLSGQVDGFTVCERIREFSDVPVIILTAKSLEADKLRGFDAGADDYLTKPFSARELLARVRAVLRRSGDDTESKRLPAMECGGLTINFAQARVTAHGNTVDLTPTEYRLLSELAKHPNAIVPHEDLLTKVWGAEYRSELDYLRAYVWYLRKKIEKNPSEPEYILSRPGLGYMLACPPGESGPDETTR